jgi:DNA-binding Xre family transcriptional regulator
MIRLRVAELLDARGWTAYELAKRAKLTMTVAYRLANPDGTFARLEAATLDKLCQTFDVQPGELLVWEATAKPKRTIRGRTG